MMDLWFEKLQTERFSIVLLDDLLGGYAPESWWEFRFDMRLWSIHYYARRSSGILKIFWEVNLGVVFPGKELIKWLCSVCLGSHSFMDDCIPSRRD